MDPQAVKFFNTIFLIYIFVVSIILLVLSSMIQTELDDKESAYSANTDVILYNKIILIFAVAGTIGTIVFSLLSVGSVLSKCECNDNASLFTIAPALIIYMGFFFVCFVVLFVFSIIILGETKKEEKGSKIYQLTIGIAVTSSISFLLCAIILIFIILKSTMGQFVFAKVGEGVTRGVTKVVKTGDEFVGKTITDKRGNIRRKWGGTKDYDNVQNTRKQDIPDGPAVASMQSTNDFQSTFQPRPPTSDSPSPSSLISNTPSPPSPVSSSQSSTQQKFIPEEYMKNNSFYTVHETDRDVVLKNKEGIEIVCTKDINGNTTTKTCTFS